MKSPFSDCVMITCAILGALIVDFSTSSSVWDLPGFSGNVPTVNISNISSEGFFRRYKIAPFVVKSFHETLENMQKSSGDGNPDPFTWLSSLFGNSSRISMLEGELQETRSAASLPDVKWKYFFERFRMVDMYALSRPPDSMKSSLRIFPFLSCGGLSSRMLAPFIWLSGGLKPSRSVIHMDSHHNQHCVLNGSKRFMLIPPFVKINSPEFGWISINSEDPPLGYEEAYGEFVADFDPDNIDLTARPAWGRIPWLLAELQAGDCLFMPEGWYHFVESKAEPTLTWHIWFDIPSELEDPAGCEQRSIKISECEFFASNSTSNCREKAH